MTDLFSLIDKKLLDLFVVDVVDNNTIMPLYDLDAAQSTLVLAPSGITKHSPSFGNQVECPLLDTITNQNVWDLLKEACEDAGNQFMDELPLNFAKMLYNPKSDGKRLCEEGEKFGVPFTANRSGECLSWIQVPFVPEDRVYFLPSAEYLGVLFHNGSKFAGAIFPRYIRKHTL